MAYTVELQKSAYRHLEAARMLAKGTCRGVAGYLYGIAAECAVKAMMEAANVRIDEAFFAHFPDLRTILRDALRGRNVKPLSSFINDDSFMNNWHVRMRYAGAKQIKDEWVISWADQAGRVVNAMGT